MAEFNMNETDLLNIVNREIDKRTAFSKMVIIDTPLDNLATVNRRYVTLNGTTRPTSSVIGQFFLDMNLASGRGKAIWWNGTGWVDGTGTYV